MSRTRADTRRLALLAAIFAVGLAADVAARPGGAPPDPPPARIAGPPSTVSTSAASSTGSSARSNRTSPTQADHATTQEPPAERLHHRRVLGDPPRHHRRRRVVRREADPRAAPGAVRHRHPVPRGPRRRPLHLHARRRRQQPGRPHPAALARQPAVACTCPQGHLRGLEAHHPDPRRQGGHLRPRRPGPRRRRGHVDARVHQRRGRGEQPRPVLRVRPRHPQPDRRPHPVRREGRCIPLDISAESVFKTALSGGNYVPPEVGGATVASRLR
jgi:hypothetical protein